MKYKDILKLYNIERVIDEYILTRDCTKKRKVYIYSVEPLVLLNISQDIQINIITTYKEILRELDIDFQIIIQNRKLDIQNYISEQFGNKLNQDELLKNYIIDLRNRLESENIFNSTYYIVVSINEDREINILEVDRIIYKLNKTGCKVKRIETKDNINKILYSSINKN